MVGLPVGDYSVSYCSAIQCCVSENVQLTPTVVASTGFAVEPSCHNPDGSISMVNPLFPVGATCVWKRQEPSAGVVSTLCQDLAVARAGTYVLIVSAATCNYKFEAVVPFNSDSDTDGDLFCGRFLV
jgi:hypothetical protein